MQRSLDPSPCPWCSEAVGLTSGHQQGDVTARCLKLELPQNHSVGQGCGDNKFLDQRMLKIDAFRTWNGQNHQMQSTESIWVSRKWSSIGASQIYWSSGDCHPGYKMLLFKTNNQIVINNYWVKKYPYVHCWVWIPIVWLLLSHVLYMIYLIYLDFVGSSIVGVWNPHEPALEYPLRVSSVRSVKAPLSL